MRNLIALVFFMMLCCYFNDVNGTSYADGTGYGCSFKYSQPHCWKYCSGNSGKWCYTVWGVVMGDQSCSDDHDCRYFNACQGWCAWNSQRGCTTACREEATTTPRPQQQQGCSRGRPWWQCQSQNYDVYNNGYRSQISSVGVWVSPDAEANTTTRYLRARKNKIQSEVVENGSPQTFLWFPIGDIRETTSTFYWKFSILNANDTIQVGLSDLNKVKPGWASRGLLYGGNLSDGSKLLISSFGPKLKTGDVVGMIAIITGEGTAAKLKIYFILNDEPLGLAFDVPLNTLDGLYPAVKFSGKGSVAVEEIDVNEIPTVIEPHREIELEGNWTLVHYGNDANVPTSVTMKLFPITDRIDDFVYRIRLFSYSKFAGELRKANNQDNFQVTIFDEPNNSGKTNDQITFESNLLNHIRGVNNLDLDKKSGKLSLRSTDQNTSTTIWQQIETKPRTVVGNPWKKSS